MKEWRTHAKRRESAPALDVEDLLTGIPDFIALQKTAVNQQYDNQIHREPRALLHPCRLWLMLQCRPISEENLCRMHAGVHVRHRGIIHIFAERYKRETLQAEGDVIIQNQHVVGIHHLRRAARANALETEKELQMLYVDLGELRTFMEIAMGIHYTPERFPKDFSIQHRHRASECILYLSVSLEPMKPVAHVEVSSNLTICVVNNLLS